MSLGAAVDDFQKAHMKAVLTEILAKATGKNADLLSYDTVRKELKLHNTAIDRGLHEIPLDAIIGSAGRYEDFTKGFFPKRSSDEYRWARVKVAIESLTGVPPIEVYKVDQVYFVIDGNHRVSVARQIGAEKIQAQVYEVDINVQLTPDLDPDDLMLKAELSKFFQQTGLNTLRPQIDFTLTSPGAYQKLLEHIHTHRYFMGIEQQHPIDWKEAVIHWCDQVYQPVLEVIQRQGLLRKFPNRSPADMYLWIMEYHVDLEKELGWRLKSDVVAANLSARFSANILDIVRRMRDLVYDWMIPDSLESGPKPGSWRRQILSTRGEQAHLFSNILVPLKDLGSSWNALEQAILMAQMENAKLLGLHVQTASEAYDLEDIEQFKQKFLSRCQDAGVSGDFSVEKGDPARIITGRSIWADLIVADFCNHPLPSLTTKLKAIRHTILRRSGRPLLAVCSGPHEIHSALLAYDGSPKAKEALFVAAYLAQKYALPLVVLTAYQHHPKEAKVQNEAKKYLVSHRIKAKFLVEKGSPEIVIERVADENNIDLLIMGSYGFKPILELVLGSTVDYLLAKGRRPILICR